MYVRAWNVCIYVSACVYKFVYMCACTYWSCNTAHYNVFIRDATLLAIKKPASSESEALLAALQFAGATASDAFVEIMYIDQQHIFRVQPLCRAHPHNWKLKPGKRRDRVVVCFSLQLRGSQATPAITKQRNDNA